MNSDDKEVIKRFLHRPADANKYDFGHVLIIGGGPGMVGAPLLAAEASLRVGAGLVTIASEASVVAHLERRVKEVMTLTLDQFDMEAVQSIMEFIRRRHVVAVAIGPGLPEEAAMFVRQLVVGVGLPCVLDAGGLAAFYAHLPDLKKAAQHNSPIILTPHTGEFARLAKITSTKTPADMQAAVVSFAKEYGVGVVLKGHHSLIIQPDGSVQSNTTGNAGLATAGTGDVLTGVIVGLLAQNFPARLAMELGVYIHGLAGDLAARAKTEPGMIASDVVEYLPQALTTIS